jgi:RNA polymerase sigma-B factor
MDAGTDGDETLEDFEGGPMTLTIDALPGDVAERRRDRLLHRYARHRDPRDLERLVISYRPLARSLARRYAAASAATEDLEQVAYEGLIKAIQRFDPDRGSTFASFAVPTILGELRRFLRDTAWPAHVPRPLQERVRQVRAAASALGAQAGRAPTARVVAGYLGCDPEAVVEALEVSASLSVASLDARPADGDEGSRTHAERLGREDPGFERVEYLASIEQVLPDLSTVQRQALRLHFGEELSCRQIAHRLGVSRAEAARDLRSAVSTLRELQAA